MLIENGVVYSPYSDQDVEGKSIAEVVSQVMHEHAERWCLVDSNRPDSAVTYMQLLLMVEKVAGFLQFHNVVPHSRVLINVHNSIEAIVAYFAVAFCNAVTINSKPSATMRELKYVVEDGKCRFVITEPDRVEMFRILQNELACQIDEIWITADSSENFEWSMENGVVSFEQVLLANEEHPFTYLEVDDPKERTSLICYTSGSTGLPKGVELTHTNVVASMLSHGSPDGTAVVRATDVLLLWNPLSHISGLSLLNSFIVTGAVAVVADFGKDFSPCAELVEKFSVSVLIAFPVALQQLSRDAGAAELRSLRCILSSGSVLPPRLGLLLGERFQLQELRIAYGLSEVGAITTTIQDHIEPYSVGHPVANCQMKVVDVDTDENLGPRQSGEILCKGPVVMKGYFNKPEATKGAFDEDGWFRTGDYGYYDEEGEFYIVERLKELIKCLDSQVNPAEIEQLLVTHESVKEAIVIGIPHETVGEAPAALVVLNEGYEGNSTLEEVLKDLVASQTSHYKHLYGGLKFTDALPTTDSGKFSRVEMKKIYLKLLSQETEQVE